MYAIMHKPTGEFVFGTDRRYDPNRQRRSKNQMLTYEHLFMAESDFKVRECGKDYVIVKLKPVEVEEIIGGVERVKYHTDRA